MKGRAISAGFPRERQNIIEKMRPEVAAGGFSRDDAIMQFYLRVNSLLQPHMSVLDLGAGRGTLLLGPESFLSGIAKLQGKVRRVVGIDVDDAIYNHPYLDERYVVPVGERYPLADDSIDVVVSDWVFEHVMEPNSFAAEVGRVLKPGGWLCARTPSKWSYVGIGARMVPNALHKRMLRWLWPERSLADVFPTVYRLNSSSAIKRYFSPSQWEHFSYNIDGPPKYHANNHTLFRIFDIVQTLTPPAFKTEMIILLRKKSGA